MQKLIIKESTRLESDRIYFTIERILDLLISIILLIVFIPLFVILSLAILVFSGRPIFFRQTRTGMNNKPFTIWKYRTMTVNPNEKKKHIYEWDQEVPGDFIFKTTNNSEVTRIGRVFRKCSLDELPQLINVLLGDMSLVGPRPEIPQITKHYNQYQIERLKVKPGITGYAQVNGRSDISHGEKIELDRYYVENCSLLLDFKIFVKTIGIVVKGGGAC